MEALESGDADQEPVPKPKLPSLSDTIREAAQKSAEIEKQRLAEKERAQQLELERQQRQEAELAAEKEHGLRRIAYLHIFIHHL